MEQPREPQRRLGVLARQLTAGGNEQSPQLVDAAAVAACCPRALAGVLQHDNPALRAAVFEFLKADLFKPNHYLSLLAFRELTLQRLKRFVAAKFPCDGGPPRSFDVRDYANDPRRFLALLECLSYADYSMAIKAGVHFTLCGGTVVKLGTQKHEDILLRLNTLDLPGSFGMTELGHGSNVMGIETTAAYDAARGEFIIHTPKNEASKAWIGGTGQHAKICAVFAQLTMGGEWQGPHVFMVRLRDDEGRIMPGVRIKDHGPKMGLNGVDNGQVWFDSVRVPRDALLDRYASVDDRGRYTSPIPSVSARFGTMVGGLTMGRILIAQGAVTACMIGTTIALRYSAARPQFGDRLILSYLTHQRRLLPGLAATYAYHLGLKQLKAIAFAPRPDPKQVHVLSAGIKAAATWTRVEVLQNCRECCGGMGVLAANKIGPMKNDMDVDVTFEGDNTVMMQQVARALLEEAKAKPAPAPAGRVALAGAAAITPEMLLALMGAYEASLLGSLRGADWDANLDLVVELGWVHTEAWCLGVLMREAAAAPPSAAPGLAAMAAFFGASCCEKRLAGYLARGLLTGADAAALRSAVNASCRALTEGVRPAALVLCEGFAIPDHLLAAPIAFNWRAIGAGDD